MVRSIVNGKSEFPLPILKVHPLHLLRKTWTLATNGCLNAESQTTTAADLTVTASKNNLVHAKVKKVKVAQTVAPCSTSPQ